MAPAELFPAKVTEKDVETINRLCHCTVQTFEYMGQVFMSAFSGRHSSFSIGSAMLMVFREAEGVENLRHRVILIYLLYRSADLDESLAKDDILEHPFLSFFLSVMDYDKETKDKEVEMVRCPKLGPREKYITGCLLTGMLDKIVTRTPVDITMMKIPNEAFDITRHKVALKNRQERYPTVASVTTPVVFRIHEKTRNRESESQISTLLSNLLTTSHLYEVLPPTFYRVTPSLMPPSDDEFQFLYPFILEPMWMETNAMKQDTRAFSTASPASTQLTTTITEDIEVEEKSKGAERTSSSPAPSVTSVKETLPVSVKIYHKAGSSLPSTPSAMTPVANEKSSRPRRTSSMISLPSEKTRKNSCNTAEELTEDVATAVTSECHTATSSLSSEKKQPYTSAEAAELLKKSLTSIITRTEAQKVADAIIRDPPLAKIIDIPLNKFDKYIDDNPAIAAAVIVDRITRNCTELPQFFKLLEGMKISVQAMEVVNKLCSQVDFPQEYLNKYIATCVRRCEEPCQTSFGQCRQPLSVELQSFVLKFNHVREAASLYQAILIALQQTTDSVTACSSTPNVSGRATTASLPAASMLTSSSEQSTISSSSGSRSSN